MYLGEASLTALGGFLTGYSVAVGLHGIADDTAVQLPRDFHDWVAYRLHFTSSTSGFKNMILKRYPDEAVAFTRFFELLDEHAVRQSRIVAQLLGFQKTYTTGPSGCERTQRYPTSISLIAYTDDPGLFAVSAEPGHPLPRDEFYPSLDWFETSMNVHRSQLTVIDRKAFGHWEKNAEPEAPPNGGPAESFGTSGAGCGPPSVT
jgi:hypothetical protein